MSEYIKFWLAQHITNFIFGGGITLILVLIFFISIWIGERKNKR